MIEHKTELRLLEGTGSPLGRFAVAWGVPGVARLDKFVDKNRHLSNDAPSDKVRNYLVEKRTLKVVGTLPLHTSSYKDGGNSWDGWGGSMKSHSHVFTYWSSSEDWAIIVHGGKWWYNAVYVVHREENGEVHLAEIGDTIENYVRAYLRKTCRAAYEQVHRIDERNPYVAVDTTKADLVKIEPPFVTFRVFSGIPKRESDPLALSADLTLEIYPYRNTLRAAPVNWKVIW